MPVKKQWYQIIAPKMFGSKEVAQTLSVDESYVKNRIMESTLLELSKEFSKFYIKVKFKIDKVEGTKAYTKFIGHDVMRERVSRMVQRRTKRVDSVVDCETKDGVGIRLKSIIILNGNVSSSIKSKTRHTCNEVLQKGVKKMDFEDAVKEIINGKLSLEIKKTCGKFSSVKDVEICKSELLKQEKKIQT